MLVPALLVAFAYWITWLIDGILGWQTMTRPIVLGTVIGLLCGDLKTGVIMGASLEAVYMGISGIGGSLAADYRSGTAVGVGLAILSGISMEEGIAIAVPIGALCLGLMPVTTMVGNLMEVPLMNAAKQGDVKVNFFTFSAHIVKCVKPCGKTRIYSAASSLSPMYIGSSGHR